MSSSRAPEPNVSAAPMFATHLNSPSSSLLMVHNAEAQLFIIVGKSNGDLLFFTESRRHTRLENAFKSPVTTICFGKLRQAGDEIAAISANGQIRSFDFPRLDDADGELQKPLPFFEQLVLANICVSHIADIDGDGLSELIVVMTDRCVRTYRYIATHLAPLNKYEVPSHVCGFSLGAAGVSGQYYTLLAQRSENCVVKIDFGEGSSTALPQIIPVGPLNQQLTVPDQPICLSLVGSLAARLLVINPETGDKTALQNSAGDFICTTTAILPNGMYLVLTVDIDGNLLIYGWSTSSLPPLEPIAIARVLPDADHLTALAGQNENEVLVSICTVYFKIAVYRINLSFILNGARMMQDVEENSSSSDVSDP